jgi:hypothetical protein
MEVISIAVINQSGTIVGTPGNDVLTGYGGGHYLRPCRRRHL